MNFTYLNREKILPNNVIIKYIKNIENTKNMDVLEIGIGSGDKSIFLSKYFKTYSGIEPNNDLLSIHKSEIENSNIQIFNVDFLAFLETNKKKYDLIILLNAIEFIGIDNLQPLFSLLNKNGYLLIQMKRRKPQKWGNEKLNIDSKNFNINLWKIKKQELKHFKNLLNKSEFLIKTEKVMFYRFYLLQKY
jgi:protein-L-isoaspartate O-methyltransferase